MKRTGIIRNKKRELTPELAIYRSFVIDHPIRRCWYCGQDRRPSWWVGAPWMIERAHIVNQQRREDRRAVILLCSACHRTEHGEKFANHQFPPISYELKIAIKMIFDTEFFDMEFLQSNSVRRIYLPEDEVLERSAELFQKFSGCFVKTGIEKRLT